MENGLFDEKNYKQTYFKLALPVVLGMVVSIVYNIADTYFVAGTNNVNLVAGVSICAPCFTVMMAFGNIYGQGGSSLISRLLGKNDESGVQSVSSYCFYAAILTGVVAGAIMLLLRGTLLKVLGANADTYEYAKAYYTVFALGAPLCVLSFIHSNLLRCEGKSLDSMIGSIVGAVINIILDPLFIYTLQMGAAGAAAATVVGYASNIAYCLYVVKKKSNLLSTKLSNAKISMDWTKEVFSIGIASAIANWMSSLCVIVLNQNLLKYGNETIAQMGIVSKVTMIVMLIVTGMSFGGAPLIGFFYGGGKKETLKKIMSYLFRLLAGVAGGLSLVLIVFAAPIIAIFMKDASFVASASTMLRIQVSTMICMSIILVITVYFQAAGKPLQAMALSLNRQGILFIIILTILSTLVGYYGVLLAQPVTDIIMLGVALILYNRYK